MDIRLLESFKSVVELCSVTGAARRLGLTQPAVSAQISRLEAEVGFPLFERLGNRLSLTAQGEAYYQEVELSLQTLSGLSLAAIRIKQGESGTLVVACHPSAGISLVPPTLARFALERPDVRTKLYTRNSEIVRSLFPSRNYDIGITEYPIDVTGLSIIRYQMECVAILPKTHALVAQDVITPELLSGVPFVSVSRERMTNHRVINLFTDAAATCEIVAEAEFFASVCSMVANGMGVSVVDPASAEQFAGLGLAVRKFEPTVHYEIAVFHAADRAPSVIAQHFLNALDERILALPGSRKV